MTTFGDIVDAIEKNGLPKVKGQYLRYNVKDGRTITGGCAIGQASLNLNVAPYFVCEMLAKLSVNGLAIEVTKLNDNSDLTLPQIAATLRERYSTLLEESVD